MPLQRLQKYLDENHVSYEMIPHPETLTAQETAAAAHIPGKQVAKVVVVSLDGVWAMIVLTAPERLDLDKLRRVTGAHEVEMATEEKLRELFEDCEVGAMPPFGKLYGLRVFVDEHLREDAQIAFNAGSHHELMRLAYDDFERLTEPVIASIHR